jgi:prepilin-type N-terminal cleavage/methylation domain-containing protein/prepilin-type processing-associated H-X9-DG protein
MKIHQSGFTLVELLVVIAIIGVLSGLMFPAIVSMQEKGRKVTCVSNLKQLHQAAVNYASRNQSALHYAAGGGRLPRAASYERMYFHGDEEVREYYHGWVDWWPEWDSSNPPRRDDRLTYWWNKDGEKGVASVTNGTLFSALGDTGDEEVYVCPTMQRAARKHFGRKDEHIHVTRSYGMNASLDHAVYHRIDGASRTILFADQGFLLQPGYNYALEKTEENIHQGFHGNYWNDDRIDDREGYERICRHFDGCIDWGRDSDVSTRPNNVEHIGEYHKGRGNAVFVDGHVESIAYDDTRYICSGAWEARQRIGDEIRN